VSKGRVKKIVFAVAVFFVFIQFVQPHGTNPPVIPSKSIEAHLQVPQRVSVILKRSCGDCHSNETVWPWYSHVAPISWLVTDDVKVGRSHINFQDWEAQVNPKEAAEHIGLICKEIQEKGMPPVSYRMMHKSSRLTDEDVKLICSWTKSIDTVDDTEDNPHH